MAWNEPGGSGNKDPWSGNNNNDQGPPEIDEVIQKLQKKLNGIFGGGGKSGQGNTSDDGGAGIGKGGFGAIVVIALLAWAASGFYIVDEGNRGVVLQFGAYSTTTGPGLHWYPRFIQTVEQVDVSGVRSAKLGYQSDESLMLTQDENMIDIKFDVQYQIKTDPEAARDYLFNVRDPDETLRQATASAVREVIGKSKMDFVITEGRSIVTVEAQNLLQEMLDSYQTGLVVKQLTMQNAQAPLQVKQAFDDVVKAREDSERFKNEAETYSNDILPRARGQAARILEEANAYKEQVIAEADGQTARFLKVLTEYEKAPAITRKRLYIDSMESVLQNSGKVIIDTKSGNNMLYLPLDRIRQDTKRTPTELLSDKSGNYTTSGELTSIRNKADSVIRENLRRREAR